MSSPSPCPFRRPLVLKVSAPLSIVAIERNYGRLACDERPSQTVAMFVQEDYVGLTRALFESTLRDPRLRSNAALITAHPILRTPHSAPNPSFPGVNSNIWSVEWSICMKGEGCKLSDHGRWESTCKMPLLRFCGTPSRNATAIPGPKRSRWGRKFPLFRYLISRGHNFVLCQSFCSR